MAYNCGHFDAELLLELVVDQQLPSQSTRGMAPAHLDTSATARSLARLTVFLVVDMPLAIGGAVTVTLVGQVLVDGVVRDALIHKDTVD